MRRKLFAALAAVLAAVLVLLAVPLGLRLAMPAYPAALAADNAAEKITGTYLVSQAAQADHSLLVFGSSELGTTDICTHPVNFFRGSGLRVDLVGRGSCQSLIHALAVGAQGENLRGRQVVLITAPQSYVSGGIASDLFMANYSQQQLLDILADGQVPDAIKTYLSRRVQDLFARYEADAGAAPQAHTAGDVLSAAWASGAPVWYLAPYAGLTRCLLDAKDLASSRRLMAQYPASAAEPLDLRFDWQAEEAAALAQAAEMATNNDFYMQIGRAHV